MSIPFHEITRFAILAQDGGGAGGGGDGGGGGGGLFGDPFFILIIMAVMVMFYLMVARPQRQKQKQLQEMLEGLKENDQVVTVGGIVGAIVSFSKDGSEVVLRTDEKSNTKMRVLRTHIARPLDVEAEEESEAKDLAKK